MVFNTQIAEIAERHLKKGAKVYVEGQLQTRKWSNQEGVERYSTEIVVSRFKGDLTIFSTANGSSQLTGATESGNGGGYLPRAGGDLDDDIPFAPQVL